MYNLIVSRELDLSIPPLTPGKGTVWGSRRDWSLPDNTTATFEYLQQFPCLFTDEYSPKQYARVGYLKKCHPQNGYHNNLEITYEFCDLPLLKHERLLKELEILGIKDNQINSYSWDIVHEDLFAALYQIEYARPKNLYSPFTFNSPHTPTKRKIAVMMPFGEKFDDVYKVIKDVSEESNLECKRVDEVRSHPNIVQDIITLIDTSEIVICVCTDLNANVFYEMGIAHTLGRKVIPIVEKNDRIPFDLSTIRRVIYTKENDWSQKLHDDLKKSIDALLRLG